MAHPYDLHRVEVLGSGMAYVDEGEGDPIVLLHGNPTSSFLWREVIPPLAELGRCIAPDLVGMGASDKLPGEGEGRYRFVEQRRYLDGFLDAVGATDRVTLVVHDWGSGLGFDWARRHPDAVRAIAYMEAVVGPISWSDWPESGRGIFQAMRSEAGEEICLDKNVFVERVLPASVLRDLTEEEMAVYRAPYREPGESRRPTLTWPREIPFDGEPADVHDIVTAYTDWLAQADLPKLHVRAEPGFLTPMNDRLTGDWPERETVTVAGLHFLQEDSGAEIGEATADWLRRIG